MTEPQQPTEEQMSTLRQISSWLLKPRSIQLKEKKDQKQQYVTDLALLPKDLKSSDFIKSKDGMVIHAPNSAKLPTLFRDRRDYLLYNNYASHAGITTLFDFCETLSAPVAALYGGPFQKRLFELIKISTDEVKALVTVKENEIPLVPVSTSRFTLDISTILNIIVISLISMIIYFRDNIYGFRDWLWQCVAVLLSGIINVWFVIRWFLFLAAWCMPLNNMIFYISMIGLIAYVMTLIDKTKKKRWVILVILILYYLSVKSHLIREDSPELEKKFGEYRELWDAKWDILEFVSKCAASKSNMTSDFEFFTKAYTPNFNESAFEIVREVNNTIYINTTVEVPIPIPGPERIKEVFVDVVLEVPVLVPGPERIKEVQVPGPERIKEVFVDVVLEVPVLVPGPERIKEVQVPGPERIKEVFVTKPCEPPAPPPKPEPYYANEYLVNAMRYMEELMQPLFSLFDIITDPLFRDTTMVSVSFITGIAAHKAGAAGYARVCTKLLGVLTRRTNLSFKTIRGIGGWLTGHWNVLSMIGARLSKLSSLWG